MIIAKKNQQKLPDVINLQKICDINKTKTNNIHDNIFNRYIFQT